MQNLKLVITGVALLFSTIACTTGMKTNSKVDSVLNTNADSITAYAVIAGTKVDTAGSGMALFSPKENGIVEMRLSLYFPSRANQTVAVHFHEHGDCSNMGEAAHGHWNPTNEKHGKWGDTEFHSGDIGNIALNADGKGEFALESARWSLGGDSKTNILNRAIIVHSGVDDYTTQPSGNSGSRIGCGVILKSLAK